ncbi:MAG: phosphoribosylamine--glycine ligase [Xanthomonadales bacterium]|nr:phosphoribosylamine--glycine ligase [Gammaproteobacteria bacterium]MBT8057148.1 phosphoribosylamine--glycine ligase [Gammaproteobacteria bacterium]NNL03679.1 phosphoribosylamine--glycine ligase [Xanthomonadales bacterium]
MRVLIVGSGGREHALAWQAARSAQVDQVYVAPGNAGTAREAGVENVPIPVSDIPALVDFAREQGIGLTIAGPEDPLVNGIVDRFEAAGLACFGPRAKAARLEGSKAFAKDFMARHGIPTAAYGKFTEVEPAIEFIREHGAPIVVKADGLAAGKGVIIAQRAEEAEAAVLDMLAGNAFGEAGHRVVVEEFLEGEEASFIVMADGRNVLPLATSQDHKPVGDGDTGPNTGGMGAYTPAPVVTDALHCRVMNDIIQPTVDGMAADGSPFTGFLYAGLMIDAEGNPRVLEYNVRFGDPETQPILMRLQSDLPELCLAAIGGHLDRQRASWDPRACLGVVMAAEGYPGSYGKGLRIEGLQSTFPEHVKVFHAGTAMLDEGVVTSGGRVLCVCALGENVTEAQAEAYAACRQIDWPGAFTRSDIGQKAVDREQARS